MKNRLIASILGRKARARSAVLAVVVGAAVFAFPTASRADDTYLDECSRANIACQTGTRVDEPSARDRDRCEREPYHQTKVCIKIDGNIVYVLDGASDGNSALGIVETPYAGSISLRHCRNPYSAGTWARCNFDWVERTEHWVHGGARITNAEYEYETLWKF